MQAYLKFPEKSDELEWKDYIKEYQRANPLEKPLNFDFNHSYSEWLKQTKYNRSAAMADNGFVPTSVFFLMREKSIIGHLSLRHSIDTVFLSNYGGHIGYGIRPSDRCKGYGTLILKLALSECVKLGLKRILITCKDTNIASKLIIEKNGGIFKKTNF